MLKGSQADYYQAVADLLRSWDALIAWARELGVEPPRLPVGMVASSSQKRRAAPKRTRKKRIIPPPPSQARQGNGAAQMTLVGSEEITVPLDSLSRPQLCLAILRLAGKPLTTQGVISKAAEIGLDWQAVSGGPSNAVHGALWRERIKGNVKKWRKGPWELMDETTAPLLDLKGRTATLSPQRISPRTLAQKRRDAMLGIMGPGRMKPLEIMLAMRKLPEYAKMPRHAVREDLEALIADGKAERAGFGLYRKGVSA